MALGFESADRIEKIATTVTVTAGSGAAVAGFTFNEWLAIAGITIAAISLVFEICFKIYRFKNAKNQHICPFVKATDD